MAARPEEHLVGGLLGIPAGILSARKLLATPVARRRRAAAAGLVLAAAVYPMARTSWKERAALGEVVALVGFGAASVLAAQRGAQASAWLLAAGWLAHACFDVRHDRGAHSLLPGWYPGACAAYDVAVASALIAGARR